MDAYFLYLTFVVSLQLFMAVENASLLFRPIFGINCCGFVDPLRDVNTLCFAELVFITAADRLGTTGKRATGGTTSSESCSIGARDRGIGCADRAGRDKASVETVSTGGNTSLEAASDSGITILFEMIEGNK